MSVSIIEGRVIEAPVKFRRKAIVRFAYIDFERADGRSQRVGKPITCDVVADRITAGAEGRFYLFKTIDVGGVAGVRLADGSALFAYPGNNLWVFGLIIPISLAWVLLRIFAEGDVPLLGVGLMVLGVVGFILTRNNRSESQRLFDADAGPVQMSRPAATGTPSTAE